MAVDLGGAWRAVVADEALRRAYPEPSFDDASWAEVAVPGHWRSSAAFADTDGPLLYRRQFDGGGGLAEGRRAWLAFDGVFYQTDIWLDGSYVGDTEGYFFPHAFEVTGALRERSEHVLAVEVACNRPRDLTAKRNITGVFQHWDCIDPAWNPGGIWRDVRIEESGPIRIARLRASCGEATPERALVSLRAVLDVEQATTVCLRTQVGGVDHEQEQPLAAGENRVSWNVVVDRPDLWWPWSLGGQPLVDVVVEVNAVGEPLSDRRALRTGLRQVRMKNWIFSVNGERLFLKGSNLGPTRMALAEASAEDFHRDVALARDAGLDLLRVHGHISRPELYEAADLAGLLLWQDFPLQWGYARGIRKQAARQAREAVDLLGHHPSIALWCGHNEPVALENPRRLTAKSVMLQELPTWNKTLLDSTVRRAFERSDSTRPVVAHSGVLPGVVSGGTDSHLYFGWYHGTVRDLAPFLGKWPRLARFVSEFGAQAVPRGWPGTSEEEQEASQRHQAEVVRRTVETLRRLKYRPTGGFGQFLFADCWPAVTFSVLDHERRPKLGFEALREACAPVIVVADLLPESVQPGDALALDVHVVSDLRVPVDGAEVRARLSWKGGEHGWAWQGDVPADSCVRVGTVQFVVPEGAGELRLDLELTAESVAAVNSYAN
jgi:beta-mannosidase